MARLKLFEYYVILHPEELDPSQAVRDQKDSVMIIDPTTILAKGEKEAVFKITRAIPEKHADDFDRIDIGIRSFNQGSRKQAASSSKKNEGLNVLNGTTSIDEVLKFADYDSTDANWVSGSGTTTTGITINSSTPTASNIYTASQGVTFKGNK